MKKWRPSPQLQTSSIILRRKAWIPLAAILEVLVSGIDDRLRLDCSMTYPAMELPWFCLAPIKRHISELLLNSVHLLAYDMVTDPLVSCRLQHPQ